MTQYFLELGNILNTLNTKGGLDTHAWNFCF